MYVYPAEGKSSCNKSNFQIPSDPPHNPSRTSKKKQIKPVPEIISESEEEEAIVDPEPEPPKDRLYYALYILYFVFWVTCYAIAIELQFGLVFLVLSALFGVYFNTRTGPKGRNEISAYSVFNKNQHSIDGTLKAEQFEREIRYGAMSVR